MIKKLVILLVLFSISSFSQKKYSTKALTGKGDLELIGDEIKLQKEAYLAFQEMKKVASKDGINIKIVSAYRSFNSQRNIWNKKYSRFISQGFSPENAIKKIIEYSTLPGTSRHHWGTDIDIIDGSVKMPRSILVEENYNNTGVYRKMKKWMDNNSKKFGFYLVYTNEPNRTGFKYEPWHYSYKPLSKKILLDYMNIELVDYYKKTKLKGKEYISFDFLEKYTTENILSINPELR